MWGFVCVLFSLRSHPVTCISVTRWNLSHILGSKQSFTAKKTEAFKGVFPVSFFSGSSVCAAFGQISGHHCFDCCVLPRSAYSGWGRPQYCSWSRRWLHQPIVSCLMPLIERWQSLWLHIRCAPDSPLVPILGLTFVVFFFPQSSGVEWYVAQVYRMMMYLFLELAVNFILLRSKPTFSQDAVSMSAF